MDENLARQAELAFERQGDYDTLCYQGTWYTSGQMADRAARLATGLTGLGVSAQSGEYCSISRMTGRISRR